MLITNRILQKLAGNWGHPSKDEKHIRLNKDVFPEEPKYIKPKKRKKDKKEFVFSWLICPFCGEKLPLDQKKIETEKERLKNRPLAGIWEDMYPVDTCPKCGSYEVPECPACKRKIWFNPTTRIYKHQRMSCGFEGIKKE